MFRSRMGLAIAICAVATCPAHGDDGPETRDYVPVESVVKNVKQALVAARNELEEEELPRLETVRLQLETIYSSRPGGDTDLFVIRAGGRFQRNRSQTLILDLKPPSRRSEPASVGDLEETLTQLILSAARSAQVIRNEPTPLPLSGATALLKFVIKRAEAGGLGYVIAPLTDELDANPDQTAVQVLSLTFEPR